VAAFAACVQTRGVTGSNTAGALQLQGGSQTASTGVIGSGGALLVAGGNRSSTSASLAAGGVTVEPGQQTGSGGGAQGAVVVYQSFKTSGSPAAGDVMCMTSTASTVQDCPAGAFAKAGILSATGSPAYAAVAGSLVTANFDGTPVTGDQACLPPTSAGTAGKLHDGGTATACPLGQAFGVITGGVSGVTAIVLVY